MSTFERVVKILAEYDVETDDLTGETTFESIGLDSLAVVEILMSCEDEFHVEIELEENPKTIGEFVAMLEGIIG
jgi:acyl carrier protein